MTDSKRDDVSRSIIFSCIAGIIVSVLFKFSSTPVISPNYYHFTYNDDTWQYIYQGLAYFEQRILAGRPPLLALLYAILFKTGLDKYLGVLNQCISLLAAVPVFIIARKLYGKETAFISAFLLLVNGYFSMFSFFLIADILCSVLIASSIACLVMNTDRSVIWAWTLIAFSFYAHNLPPIAATFPLCLLIIQGRHFYRRKSNFIGLGIAVILFALYFVFFFNYTNVYSRNLRFAGVEGTGVITGYLIKLAFVTGPGCLFLIPGLSRSFTKNTGEIKKSLFLAAWFVPFLLFFGVVYAMILDPRFVVFFLYPVIIMVAHGLAILAQFTNRSVVIVLILLTSLSMNSAAAADLNTVGKNSLVIFPGLTLTEDGRLKKQATTLAHWYYFKTDKDYLRRTFLASIFPQDVAKVAEILKNNVGDDEYYSILPFNFRAITRLYTRLLVLSGRKIGNIQPQTVDDPKRAVIILLKLPPSEKDLREGGSEYTILNVPVPPDQVALHQLVLSYLTNYNLYEKYGEFGIFSVYIRKKNIS